MAAVKLEPSTSVDEKLLQTKKEDRAELLLENMEVQQKREIQFRLSHDDEDGSSSNSEQEANEYQLKSVVPQASQEPVKLVKVASGVRLRPCNSCEILDLRDLYVRTGCFGFCKRKLKRVKCFWIISVPREGNSWERLQEATAKTGLSHNYKFHIPELKVGTLDVLVSQLEELKNLDKHVWTVTERLCRFLKDEMSDQKDAADYLKVQNMSPATYLTNFAWCRAKYPTWRPIPAIAAELSARVWATEDSFREKVDKLTKLRASLRKYEQRGKESLLQRYLADIVPKEQITDTEFLATLLVVVPKHKEEEWLATYHTLAPMVAPDSSEKILEDSQYVMFKVLLIRNSVQTFTENAAEKEYMVRDVNRSVEDTPSFLEGKQLTKERQAAALFRWTKIHFGECFEAWAHVKALRVFVESVLRFGLPVDHQAVLMLPLGSRNKLRGELNKLFSDMETQMAVGNVDDLPGGLLNFDVEVYYPYVFFEIALDSICTKL